MKKLILLFFTSFCGFSQERVIEVYNYDQYGIRDISSSKIIEIKIDKTEIYSVDKYGIKSLNPTEIIIDNKLYEFKDNLQQLLPRQSFEESTLPPVDSTPVLDFRFQFPIIFDF